MPVSLPSIEPRASIKRFADRRGFGALFAVHTHGPNAGRPVCIAPGRAARLADFASIADLPVGTRIVAADRAESTWVFTKAGVWVPQSEFTGTFLVSASRTLDASDNRAILYNSTAKTLTVPPGLPDGFELRGIQAGPGALTFNFSAVTVLNAKVRTSGAGGVARLIHLGGNTYTLTGDAA